MGSRIDRRSIEDLIGACEFSFCPEMELRASFVLSGCLAAQENNTTLMKTMQKPMRQFSLTDA
jgi:hypothetical protein